jgi:excinuclease ABC subunit C
VRVPAHIPDSPGVYLFRDAEGRVIYVGKARSLRRRLSAYRNASRRKAHRKMRRILRESSDLELRPLANEGEALLHENDLIKALVPRLNVEGAYSFLYPAIGVVRGAPKTLLCFTTAVEAWSAFGFTWVGTFRSRLRAREAFDALASLLALIGHREPKAALGNVPRIAGSRIVGFRQLPPELIAALGSSLAGRSAEGLTRLAHALLEKPRARREAPLVEEQLHRLRDFFESDLKRLREVLSTTGRAGTFVPQRERDELFIRARWQDRSEELVQISR